MRVVVLHPCTKFEVRISLAVRKMCVSVNGPCDLEPLTLKLVCESHQRWGNLHSEFGHARPSGSQVIRYVRDGRTDKSNA